MPVASDDGSLELRAGAAPGEKLVERIRRVALHVRESAGDAFEVSGFADYQAKLAEAKVMLDPGATMNRLKPRVAFRVFASAMVDTGLSGMPFS